MGGDFIADFFEELRFEVSACSNATQKRNLEDLEQNTFDLNLEKPKNGQFNQKAGSKIFDRN